MEHNQIIELQRWQLLDFKNQNIYGSENKVIHNKIIIVCGCGRSGTTLMRVMLDSHSLIYCGPETHLFLPIEVNAKDLSYKLDIPLEEMSCITNSSTNRIEIIERLMNTLLSLNGKALWSDKTARNIHCLDFILKYFPNAKIIHMIRNPYDVVASLKTHKKRHIVNDEIIPTGYIMPLKDCIDRWLLSIKNSLPYRNFPNYIEVKYENLVLQPQSELERVCNFCEIPFEKDMVNFHTIKSSTRNFFKFPQNIEATLPLYTSSVSKYQQILTQEEINKIASFVKQYSKIIGYE